MIWKSEYFCGNKVSAYGLENGYVDYATLAKSFDAVLNNEIMGKTFGIGEWEQENGWIDNSDEIDEIQKKEDEIERLEDEQDNDREIFQWYIISDNGASILKDYTNEIVYYNSELDMYLWGVTHWGTSWDYVLTDIKIEIGEA